MKIYVTHSTAYDYAHELYKPLRTLFDNTDHELILPHATDEFINSRDIIPTCDLVLAEVSLPSTGQGIELGWASVAQIPIVCLHRDETKPSSALSVVSDVFLSYESSDDMTRKLQVYLDSISDNS